MDLLNFLVAKSPPKIHKPVPSRPKKTESEEDEDFDMEEEQRRQRTPAKKPKKKYKESDEEDWDDDEGYKPKKTSRSRGGTGGPKAKKKVSTVGKYYPFFFYSNKLANTLFQGYNLALANQLI